MNKVASRCQKKSSAKFLYASNKMFYDLKVIKFLLYLLNIIPVVICFLPQTTEQIQLICSLTAFGLTLINEVASALLIDYKKKAILLHQLYEAEITGSSFSKIEYDRETTNDLNETAIRKGLPKMRKKTVYPTSNVPQEITDDYSYLYLCRISASKTRFLLSRMFYIYVLLLITIGIIFISATFMDYTTGRTLYLLVCFWPLILPFIKNCVSCKICTKDCIKICADIDNFFADGDASVERLARFYYYVQNIEFEMLSNRPIIYKFIVIFFSRGANILAQGVTDRFNEAIIELKGKSLINKGLMSQPKGKSLITKKEYNMEDLAKLEKSKKTKSEASKEKSSPSTLNEVKEKTTHKKTTSTK